MEWNPTDVEDKLHLQFKSEEMLRLALTDLSYAEQANEPETNNIRLEYLGRSVLELAIADYLYRFCPYLETGKCARLVEKLAGSDRLTSLWFHLDLGNTYPFLAASESRPLLRKQAQNPFEKTLRAVVGAIHRDRGYVQARNWLQKHLIAPLLEKHLKKITERKEPEKQLRWLGDLLLPAILDDHLFEMLPEVDVDLLCALRRALTTNAFQTTWAQHLTDADRERLLNPRGTKPVQMLLAQAFLDYSSENEKLAFRQARDWFVERFLDKEAILREAIVRLQARGVPQKWLVHNVLGYSSKDYHDGRDRLQEILTGKSAKQNAEEKQGEEE
ncbi:dsRNA-specific ribonuclease [Rubidibacter lacunae KORDI 51-2]|uniref:DsRNA-specific ribonuclease n=1 Tax=Rubidibacter lacunae KORDI 51-2 TaxID=582515 RepID=U5DB80_9CHRO|nr:ribonuclease III domain-containing protein [Rubidibacter lacunae]ERN41798.1 dsRNA-specific ribonuclease [Rubidibacter lacunae KORDI 51-2]